MDIRTENVAHSNAAKYKNARILLLAVLIFSLINALMILGDSYFLFSSYLTTLIEGVGISLFIEFEYNAIFLVLTIVLVIISLLPYLFCFIFSKKHHGWLIAALVLFSIDTAILIFDAIGSISEGNASLILDLAIHVYVLVSLAIGVVAGIKLKNETEEPEQLTDYTEEAITDNQSAEFDPALAGVGRTITLNRKKSFYGSAVKFICMLDGKSVGDLKNGKSLVINTDGNAHVLTVAGGACVAKTVQIEAGCENREYQLFIKMNMMTSEIMIVE